MDLVKKSVFDHLGHQTMNSFHCGFTSEKKTINEKTFNHIKIISILQNFYKKPPNKINFNINSFRLKEKTNSIPIFGGLGEFIFRLLFMGIHA